MSAAIPDSHIETTPDVLGGKPRIAGRRIAVEHIVVWHEWMGRPADEIAGEYDLSLADIYAALAYYYDHRQEIDDSLRAGEQWVEEMRRQIPTKLPPFSR